MAFLARDLDPGGVQRVAVVLAEAFVARGARVDLVTCESARRGGLAIPEGVRVVPLRDAGLVGERLRALRADPAGFTDLAGPLLAFGGYWRLLRFFSSLVGYLAAERPACLFTGTTALNVLAVLARRAAGVPTRVIISERTHFSASKDRAARTTRLLARAMRRAYGQADAIVTVSRGLAEDLAEVTGLPRAAMTTIYNPVITPDFESRLSEACDCGWFATGEPPVILSVGRLTRQKDYPTLLRAFARVRRGRPARLAIIGDASKRAGKDDRAARLERLAAELGVAEDTRLLGPMPNPIPCMSRAAVFVLSSIYEGFGNVLLEALAAGAPIVSTDCPAGPREILAGGDFGRLVPVGDDGALAAAIEATLDDPPPPERQKRRAADFDYAATIERYERLLLGLPDPSGV